MLLQTYQPHDLSFAYCYHAYLRWQTSHNRPYPPLARLNTEQLNKLVDPYGIRILESASAASSLTTLVSLEPTETISTCASKMKGRVSKWLSEELKLIEPEHLVSRGYFARTVGKSKPELIEEYLERQASHHGYDKRKLPPVFVKEYQLTANDKARLAAKHADALAQFHIVLASSYRVGVFGSGEGRTIASEWRRQQESLGIAIRKISFVPDHVHAAIRAHPATSLAVVVATLMNIAQASVPQALIRAGIDRLWTPSAYLGSYGNFATGEIGSYIQRLSFS